MLKRILLLAAAAAAILVAVPPGATFAQAAGHGSGSGCTGYKGGGGWFVTCQNGGSPGGGGGSSSGGHQSCFWSAKSSYFPAGFRKFAPPAPKGYIYLVQVCGSHGQYVSLPQLFANGGALTPQALAQQAYAELAPPLPVPQTAPPRGSDGLTGLPQWFWVPANQWAPITARVAVGHVWAAVTATPAKLVFSPGGGQSPITCPGPGVPYDRSKPASAQSTPCSYTYTQSSDGMPGNAYTVSVTIQWAARWVGSGGSGGTLPPKATTATFALPVAEAQSLCTTC